jgi:hypothetical protein
MNLNISTLSLNQYQLMVLVAMQTSKSASEKGIIPLFDEHTVYGSHDNLIQIGVPNL